MLTESIDTPTIRKLNELGISYALTTHSEAVYSCKDVATVRNRKLSQVLKCMIAKDKNNNIYGILLPGNKIICKKKLRLATGGLRISLFSPSELVYKFGFVVGAISPIQLLGNATFYLDETVLSEEAVDISSGSPNMGIMLKTKDLIALISPIIYDMATLIQI